ncbi:MAG: ThiF family adenylyltransferase [Thermoanaerobaculia bacterium]
MLDEDARLRELIDKGTIATYSWKRQPNGELWLLADLRLGQRTQAVEVRFPPRYPGECPSMRPIPYGKRLSDHQFGGDGVLCLELGPDNWHARFMAADLLQSAWVLLALETINTVEPIPIPSRHVDTLGMTVRSNFYRLLLTRDVLRAIDVSGSVVPIEYCAFFEDAALVFWITHVPSGNAVTGLPPRIAERDRKAGLAVRLPDDAAPPPNDVEGFRAYLRGVGVPDEEAAKTTGLVLLTTASDALARYVPDAADQPVRKVAVIAATGTTEERIGATAAATLEASVAIVGLGSLGSKLAASLVRSGVRTVTTVDGDVLLPVNVVRHEADFRHVGLMKTEAAAARMRDVASSPISLTHFDHDVVDGSNPSIHVQTTEALRATDLIIDATASADAFNFLADLASEEQRPLVWGEIFAGGLGGYVAYAVPGMTPCPSCVRSAFLAHLTEWPPAPRATDRPYGALTAEGPIVATDADVSVIAGALTNLALRVLLREIDGRDTIIVIGLRRGWIFSAAFESRALPVRSDDFSCDRCWTKPSAADPSTLADVERLLSNADAAGSNQP